MHTPMSIYNFRTQFNDSAILAEPSARKSATQFWLRVGICLQCNQFFKIKFTFLLNINYLVIKYIFIMESINECRILSIFQDFFCSWMFDQCRL